MPVNETMTEYELAPAPARAPLKPLEDLKRTPAPSRSLLDLTPLFMVLGAGLVIGTILQQQKLDYCPNDAARWNTIYCLVEHGQYEYVARADYPGVKSEHGAWWNEKTAKRVEDVQGALPFWTIDMVAFKDGEGKYHFHSSKPPLLSTIAAGVVLGIEKVTWVADAVLRAPLQAIAPGFEKKTLQADYRVNPWFIMRTTLILAQAIPFMFFIWLTGKIIRQMTDSSLALNFGVAVAALGTYLTPWTITLNNHAPAAFMALFAVYAVIKVWYEDRREWYWFAMAGFFGALCASFEMPGLALTAAVLAALLWKDWRRTLGAAIPLALIPAAGFFLTNYLELGSFKPVQMRFNEPDGPYHYPGSYWNKTNGMDALAEPKPIYLMHLLIGHRGLFLLTPVLLLGLLGAGRHLRQMGLGFAFLASLVLLAAVGAVVADGWMNGSIAESLAGTLARFRPDKPLHLPRGYALLAPLVLLLLVNVGMYLPALSKPRPMLALVVLVMSAAVIAFYTIDTNNYGGGVQGPRWLFWLIPFWVLLLPAGVEWMARARVGRLVCYSLLLVSMMSVAFAFREPWGASISWAHTLFRNLGWIKY